MPNLDFKEFTISRIEAFLLQIHLLKEVDYPYSDSREALDFIFEHINKQKKDVENSLLTSDSLKSRCSRSTKELSKFHRYLGYLAKSPDPINNFEIYFLFRRIAESILGEKVRLIMNSEWDSYSPINLDRPLELINFVFIGLPVSESNNSLIVPLAGHELGHSIWFSDKIENISYEKSYRQILQKKLKTILSKKNLDSKEISIIVNISLNKLSEYFCDFIGLGIFGESYLYAFAYLLAPKVSKELNYSHPNAANRVTSLIKAAIDFGYNVPKDFIELFKTQVTVKGSDYNRLKYSEDITYKMIDQLINDVKKLLASKNVLYKRSSNYNKIKNELLSMYPISTAETLADITNVSWDIYFDRKKWDKSTMSETEKINFLNELTIKSFEILEIKQRLQEYDIKVR